MKTLRYFLAALALCLLPVSAQAATCYISTGGGSVNWSDSTKWFAGSGGTGGACGAAGGYPSGSSDIGYLNASSGGGTVTVDVALSILTIDESGFTGTLSDTAQAVTLAQGYNCGSGSSATLSLGSVTWTVNGVNNPVWGDNGTCLATVTATSSTLKFAPSSAGIPQINLGGHHYGTIELNVASNTHGNLYSFSVYSGTIDTLTLDTVPMVLTFGTSNTYTFTNPWAFVGTASNPISISGSFGGTGAGQSAFALSTLGNSTCAYCGFSNMKFTTGALVATNSFNFGIITQSGGTASITGPSGGGGGGYIIGGQ